MRRRSPHLSHWALVKWNRWNPPFLPHLCICICVAPVHTCEMQRQADTSAKKRKTFVFLASAQRERLIR